MEVKVFISLIIQYNKIVLTLVKFNGRDTKI